MILKRTLQSICILTTNPNTTTSIIVQVSLTFFPFLMPNAFDFVICYMFSSSFVPVLKTLVLVPWLFFKAPFNIHPIGRSKCCGC